MDIAPTVTDAAPTRGERTAAAVEPRISAVAVAAVVLILGLGAALGLRNQWTPVLDIAALEIRVQAIPEFIPQVGVFSRMGWFHPGPAIFFQSWLPYRVWGPVGLNIAMVAVHLVALVTAWWLARRQDRLAGGMLLVTMLVVLFLEPPVVALEPWNPYAGTIASFTFLMAAWGTSQRHWAATALLLPIASYLLHNHLGYAPFVGLVTVIAVVLSWLASPAGITVPWKAWSVGGFTSAVMWLPVLWQQVTGDPGNVSALVNTPADGERAGLTTGVQALFDAFAVLPYWVGADALGFRSGWQIPWLLLVPVAGAVAAMWRRDALAKAALAICAGACVAAVVAIAATTGPLVGYLVIWLPVTAATSVALGLWALVRGAARASLTIAFAVASVVVALLVADSWANAEQEYPEYGRASLALGTALHEEVQDGPVYLSNLPGQGLAQQLDIRQVYYGVLATATRSGTEVIVPEPIAWEVAGVLSSTATPGEVPGLPHYAVAVLTPDLTDVVAISNPLDPRTTDEFLRLQAEIVRTPTGSAEQDQLIRARDELAEGRFPFALVRITP